MIDAAKALRVLSEAGVDFVVVGGAAAIAHGSARLTLDLDVVYARTAANIERLAAALAPHDPYLRGAPRGLPFSWDAETIRRGLNFTLTTAFGDLDLLGEIAGGGGYQALLPHSAPLSLFGVDCRCLSLERLIHVKRAAGRPKDLEAIAELEALKEERDKG
jgi:predicted nucleotidyltransferase